jgi:hypothetical protein
MEPPLMLSTCSVKRGGGGLRKANLGSSHPLVLNAEVSDRQECSNET